MANFMTGSPKRMLIVSLSTFVIALIAVISMGFAWFSLSNWGKSSMVATVGDINANYEFYVYLDQSRLGDSSPAISNDCSSSSDDTCYWLKENTSNPANEPVFQFGDNDGIVPGNKFSFALKITNIGNMDAYVDISFKNLISEGFYLSTNKIQRAFYFQVTRMTYFYNGYEGPDINNSLGIVSHENHFLVDFDEKYSLVESIPLGFDDPDNSSVIVYFDIFFDPNISGLDAYGNSTNSSNEFEDQIFTISQIEILLKKQ
jgi:hypothetical protein